MTENAVKLGAAAVLAAIIAYFEALAIPFILVMLIDYISGVAAASVCKELSSRTGIMGIIKRREVHRRERVTAEQQ